VTGASQGIGLALVKQLAARSDVTVFAGVRTLPLKPESELQQLATKQPEVVIPILITAADEADNAAAAETVKAKTGKVDVIIANSGKTNQLALSDQADSKKVLLSDLILCRTLPRPTYSPTSK
jgi:NAD(P)-dependent dehydrogenase (short-subunit alcohol dehydrogenase family)